MIRKSKVRTNDRKEEQSKIIMTVKKAMSARRKMRTIRISRNSLPRPRNRIKIQQQ